MQGVLAKADFTGGGFADFAFIQYDSIKRIGNINVFTALDVNDETQGFFYATPTALPHVGFGSFHALAAGDFDGDGVKELALVSYIT